MKIKLTVFYRLWIDSIFIYVLIYMIHCNWFLRLEHKKMYILFTNNFYKSFSNVYNLNFVHVLGGCLKNYENLILFYDMSKL